MAWDPFRVGRVRGISGDIPHYVMGEAINRINRAYLERYGRRAYLAELLYALLGEVALDVPASVADAAVPPRATFLSCLENSPFDHIDPGEYEAGIDAESHDFLVSPRVVPLDGPDRETVVVRGTVEATDDSELLCRYSLHSHTITDGMAQCLIRQCVLQDLLDYDIVGGGLVIHFERID
jgi:hypothetical protein